MAVPKIISEDKVFKKLIEKVGEIEITPPNPNSDVYFDLIVSIISQQLSSKAANTIKNRFLDLFPGKYPSEKLVILKTTEELRSVGLSFQKAGYIKNIAQFSLDKGLTYKQLSGFTNDEIINYLTQIKGVGKWTAEMVLIFSLNRPDVFPIDDLVVRNAVAELFQIKESKTQKKELIELSEKWKPYRTYVSKLVWKWKDLGTNAGV